MEEKEIYRKAIRLFGIESQKAMAIEECAELIQAICHTGRNRTKYSIAEETADVEIMCGQLRQIVGDHVVQNWKAKKISRLKELILKDNKKKTEKVKAANKKYYQKNKEKMIKRSEKYYKQNIEKVKEYRKEYYQKNKKNKGE